MTGKMETLYDAAFEEALNAGFRPDQAEHLAQTYGKSVFGTDDPVLLRKRLSAEHNAIRARLRQSFPDVSAETVRVAFREALHLVDAAGHAVQRESSGKRVAEALASTHPGFSATTYVKAISNARFANR
jgi:hypothetical protein